jgi:DNA polymerase-4
MRSKTIIFIELRNFHLRCVQKSGQLRGEASIAVAKDGKVLEASKQALTAGVTPGITIKLAKKRCPSLQLHDFDPDGCQDVYHTAWSYFANLTPQVEPISLHAGYLDLTGCFPHTVSATKFVSLHQQKLFEATGLEFLWGGGENRWIAWMARCTGWYIPSNKEQGFLAHIPIQKLEISDVLIERLLRYGTQTVAQYLALPPSFLKSHLQLSHEECDAANRRETRDIKCAYPPASITVTEDFSWGVDSEYPTVIERACDAAHKELVQGSFQAGQVTIQLSSKRETVSEVIKPSKPVSSRAQLHRLITGFVLERRIKQPKKLELSLDLLIPDFRLQLNLWHSATQTEREASNLETARLRLSTKYGQNLLLGGSEYLTKHPPRFAQLIYTLQGRLLP